MVTSLWFRTARGKDVEHCVSLPGDDDRDDDDEVHDDHDDDGSDDE